MKSKHQARKIMPVCLLLEGLPCLVVGGGEVAARKARHLLDAGALVTVVSPRLCPRLARWKRSGRISHEARPFAAADVKGRSLVFAATDQGAVNLSVMKACRRARVLCSAVDEQWAAGDFITPAIIRRGRLTVGVSTGGASCKQARAIKEHLAQWLALLRANDKSEPMVVRSS